MLTVNAIEFCLVEFLRKIKNDIFNYLSFKNETKIFIARLLQSSKNKAFQYRYGTNEQICIPRKLNQE